MEAAEDVGDSSRGINVTVHAQSKQLVHPFVYEMMDEMIYLWINLASF